jgi:hypothetical protein
MVLPLNYQRKMAVLLSPLFDADHSLTLEQVKNGELPSALNYITESVIRKNKDLICQNSLEQLVEKEHNQKPSLS